MADKKTPRKKRGLGIGALLSNIDAEIKDDQEAVVKKLASSVANIQLTSIEVNPFQPRTEFDQDALQELSNSISIHGLIQPLTVRRLDNEKFQLISGERRMRASIMAGLKAVPAYIRLADDQEMLEMALVENIQRENLNAMEIAFTYKRLMDECSLTHDTLSGRVGKKRSTVTNYLRLLKLPPQIQEGIKVKSISMGHARALLSVDDLALQLSLYNEILAKRLSVRQVEELVKQQSTPKTKSSISKLPLEFQKVQDDLCSRLGTKVAIKTKSDGKGQVVINYLSTEDLNRILDIMDGE